MLHPPVRYLKSSNYLLPYFSVASAALGLETFDTTIKFQCNLMPGDKARPTSEGPVFNRMLVRLFSTVFQADRQATIVD